MDLLNNLLPTLIGVAGGIIGWFLKSKFEAKRRVEESLRDEAAKIYLEILLPFATLYTDLSEKNQKETVKKITSQQYREKSFKLILVGSDDVVKAWNSMWSTVYRIEQGKVESKELLLSFGDVLLTIRRSLGNSDTSMSNKDMLRWLIKDIDTFEK